MLHFEINNCRICYSREELHNVSDVSSNGSTYYDQLMYTVPEVDWSDDSFPSLVCQICIKNIEELTDFKLHCIQSNIPRMKYIKTVADKMKDLNLNGCDSKTFFNTDVMLIVDSSDNETPNQYSLSNEEKAVKPLASLDSNIAKKGSVGKKRKRKQCSKKDAVVSKKVKRSQPKKLKPNSEISSVVSGLDETSHDISLMEHCNLADLTLEFSNIEVNPSIDHSLSQQLRDIDLHILGSNESLHLLNSETRHGSLPPVYLKHSKDIASEDEQCKKVNVINPEEFLNIDVISTKDSNSDIVDCVPCNVKFSTPEGLKIHQNTVHKYDDKLSDKGTDDIPSVVSFEEVLEDLRADVEGDEQQQAVSSPDKCDNLSGDESEIVQMKQATSAEDNISLAENDAELSHTVDDTTLAYVIVSLDTPVEDISEAVDLCQENKTHCSNDSEAHRLCDNSRPEEGSRTETVDHENVRPKRKLFDCDCKCLKTNISQGHADKKAALRKCRNAQENMHSKEHFMGNLMPRECENRLDTIGKECISESFEAQSRLTDIITQEAREFIPFETESDYEDKKTDSDAICSPIKSTQHLEHFKLAENQTETTGFEIGQNGDEIEYNSYRVSQEMPLGKKHVKPRQSRKINEKSSSEKVAITELNTLIAKEYSKQFSFKCDDCGTLFRSKDNLVKHLKSHYEQNLCLCDICGKTISKDNLLHHKERHKDKLKHACKFCPMKYKTHNSLQYHVLTKHKEKKFSCPCGYVCATVGLLKVHMRRHNKDFKYVCDICNKGFVARYELKRHLPTHSARKSHYYCEVCDCFFKDFRAYDNHYRKHDEQRNADGKMAYECVVCKANNFSNSAEVQEHMKCHSNQVIELANIKQCIFCKTTFASQNLLFNHMSLHGKKVWFQCRLCNKQFSYITLCKMHVTMQHSVQMKNSNVTDYYILNLKDKES